jgi:hypothetical protein
VVLTPRTTEGASVVFKDTPGRNGDGDNEAGRLSRNEEPRIGHVQNSQRCNQYLFEGLLQSSLHRVEAAQPPMTIVGNRAALPWRVVLKVSDILQASPELL